jgi:hypothetical protein
MLFPHFAIVLATICLLNHPLATAIPKNAATLPNGVESSAGCQKCQSSLSFAGAKAKEYAVGTQMYVFINYQKVIDMLTSLVLPLISPGLPFKTKTHGQVISQSKVIKSKMVLYSCGCGEKMM